MNNCKKRPISLLKKASWRSKASKSAVFLKVDPPEIELFNRLLATKTRDAELRARFRLAGQHARAEDGLAVVAYDVLPAVAGPGRVRTPSRLAVAAA